VSKLVIINLFFSLSYVRLLKTLLKSLFTHAVITKYLLVKTSCVDIFE